MRSEDKRYHKNYKREMINDDKYSIRQEKLHDENHNESILREYTDEY